MGSNYQEHSSHSPTFIEMAGDILLKILVVLLAFTVLPLLLVGLFGSPFVLKNSLHPRRDWCIIAASAVIGVVLFYHFYWPLERPGQPYLILVVDFIRGLRHDWHWDYWRLGRELLTVWAMDMLLAPCAICFGAVYEMARPKTVAQLAKEQKQQQLATTRQGNKVAEHMLTRKSIPDALMIEIEKKMGKEPALVLGIPIEGTLLKWIKERFFCLPLVYLQLHAVVIGASGYGKSETLIRIAVAAAKVLGWQVIFVDAKGDYKNAAKFLLAMKDAGITNVKMFPYEAYNGWVGTRDALLSRLLSIDKVGEVTTAGQQHYQTVTENLLEMVVNMPGGPPTCSQDVLDRLNLKNGLLYDAYQGYPEQQDYLDALLERPQEALGTYGHYRAFFAKLHGKLDGAWSYDTCDAAYVLLDGLALPEIVDGLGRYLLADFVNYATRKKSERRTLFVFDEVGVLNVPLYKTFETVRFCNVSVMVSSQDPTGLAHRPGAWDEVKRVLGNAAIKIVHKSEDAYEVLRRAGTKMVPEQDYRLDSAGMATGGGTARMREELKIDPNDVLALGKGETFVIGPGEYERVRVAKLDVDSEQLEDLYQELLRQSKEEPAPLKRRQRGGQQIVDAVPASSPQTTPTKPQNKTSLGVPTPQAKNGKQGKGASSEQTSAKPVSPSPLGQSGTDVDETLPFSLPEIHEVQAPTQPGVLPMWNADEGEDLLK